MNPRELPVYELEDKIAAVLRSENRLILQAPTGSGKSTQVPQILLDRGVAGTGEIVVLQPRRLATRLLASRVAAERGGQLGQEVGYQIRLENVTSARTRIRFSTEGVLLRQMLADPALEGISVIVFDEFHERHLQGDVTLARAVDLQATRRPDLRLVVMSATLDTRLLEPYLAPCEVLTSSGRTHPVTIEYLPRAVSPGAALWDLTTDAVERLASRTEGDFLVFLPGSYEINRTIQAILQRCKNLLVLPLHGELSPADQDAAVARYERRKVVVSTNVAETSLTIDGVRVVIDSGLARMAHFDPNRGIDTLLIEKISRASADQRAGRAGRTAPGLCLRLWTEREQEHRPAQELPEIKRRDLAEVVLTLAAGGVTDVREFRWLEAPDSKALGRAQSLLADLGALDQAGSITETGRRMLTFPLHPRYARMLLAAGEYGCVEQIALIAALTQGRGILQKSTGRKMDDDRDEILGRESGSDFFQLMRAWHYADGVRYDVEQCRALGIHAGAARQARPLYEMFLRLARHAGLSTGPDPSSESIERCVLLGFADQVARRLDRGTLRCELVHGRRGNLARESVVQDSDLLVAAEVIEIEGREVSVLLNLCTAIREEWLRDLFPLSFRSEQTAFYDAPNRRVVGEERVVFRDLVLRSRRTEKLPPEQAAALLAAEVVAGRLILTHWDNTLEQWIVRLNRLVAWMPDLHLPPLHLDDRELLLQQALHGASSYREIKDRPVAPAVKGWLSPLQQGLLEKFAPEKIRLPNGRSFKIVYDEKAAPTVSIRIQDLYGVDAPLTICGGRVPLVIQVLAPNHRPIQVTTDLKNFWVESYPEIRQQLQRRYPKHEWR